MQKTSFTYLIICILFSSGVFCQNLNLQINGISQFETVIIDSLNYKKNHKNYLAIQEEIYSLQKKLFQIGYVESDLKHIKKLNDSLFLANISLKKKYKSIHIYYDKSIVGFKILSMVSKEIFDDYFKLDFNNLENALNYINSKISEKGYPFSKISLSNITIGQNSNLVAKLVIQSNEQKRIINNIVIKGYDKFPKSYLKYYLKIKPHQTFNLEVIKNKTQQLADLKFASETKSPDVLFTKDSTTLYIYLQKKKSNSFDGFLGFGTKEETNKLEFTGYIDLNLTNNLNYGESFKLLYKGDQNDQKTFSTKLSLPYLFNSPIGLDLMLSIFKRDSSFTTINQSAKIHYQLNSKHKISAGILGSQSNNLLQNISSSSISDFKTNYFSFEYQFLIRQNSNYLFPINSFANLESDFGSRIQNNNKEKQYLLNFNAFKIFNLDRKNSIFLKLNCATLESKTYFENELLRFGGINSIRGFEENSIYASLLSVFNTEYRYQINNSIYLHTITDFGYFENKIADTKEKLLGFGFGFGILTKAGLLKFNYANGKNENTQFKLLNSKIHLSLTADF